MPDVFIVDGKLKTYIPPEEGNDNDSNVKVPPSLTQDDELARIPTAGKAKVRWALS
ncbi:MAG: hypothetical protein Q9227_009348 [Pyrenula ochraceoflavens]